MARDSEERLNERRKAWAEGRFADAAKGLLTFEGREAETFLRRAGADAAGWPLRDGPTLAEEEAER